MPRSIWSWVHPIAGAGILAVLLWRLGSGPFVAGLRLIDARALGAALGIGVLTTWACAWRWSLVRRRPRGAAAAADRGGPLLPRHLPQRDAPGWCAR